MFIDNQEFVNYMFSVYGQLSCNACKEYQAECITYTYTSDQVNRHIDYFKDCFDRGLSSYKALLFFSDYFEDFNENVPEDPIIYPSAGV